MSATLPPESNYIHPSALVPYPTGDPKQHHIACDAYRVAKARCDRHKPSCESCRMRPRSCIYLNGQRKLRGKPHGDVRLESRDLRLLQAERGGYPQQQQQHLPLLLPWGNKISGQVLSWNGNGSVEGMQSAMPPPPPPLRNEGYYTLNARPSLYAFNGLTRLSYLPIPLGACEDADPDPGWSSWVQQICSYPSPGSVARTG